MCIRRWKRWTVCGAMVLAAMVLAISSAAAQTKSSAHDPTQKAAAESHKKANEIKLDRAYLQKVMDAWSTMNPDNVAQYYDQAAEAVFFDITPMQNTGWKQYDQYVREGFANYTSYKIHVNDDTRVHMHGDWAWSTATWHADTVAKDGTKDTSDVRWTAIWQRRGGAWVIVHDHNSLPFMAQAAAAEKSNP